MARIRYLKPDFFKDEDLAELTFWIRLLFAGLWNIADKEGRLEDRSKRIKVDIFPYDTVDIEKGLTTLSVIKPATGLPFIQRYQVNGLNYIQIIKWHKHQKPHHTEKNSDIPPPPTPPNGEGNGEGNGKPARSELEVKQRLDNRYTFKPPTAQEAEEYAKSIGFVLDGEKFVAHYGSANWFRGKTKITDWKQCVVTWKKGDNNAGKSGHGQGFKKGDNTAGTGGSKYDKAGIPE